MKASFGFVPQEQVVGYAMANSAADHAGLGRVAEITAEATGGWVECSPGDLPSSFARGDARYRARVHEVEAVDLRSYFGERCPDEEEWRVYLPFVPSRTYSLVDARISPGWFVRK